MPPSHYHWHLVSHSLARARDLAANSEEQWSWVVWKDEGCEGLRQLNQEAMVANLAEQGGWHLVRDSITESHASTCHCYHHIHPHLLIRPCLATESISQPGITSASA
jgi:hypothetical protein